jgi:hypothetical protein
MNKTVLLAATAVLALTAGGALAGSHPTLGVRSAHIVPIQSPGGMLYNQNRKFGYAVESQNFSSNLSANNSAGADDFVVPAGKIWKIKAVDVTGEYDGSGSATSEVITVYKDSNGKPGRAVGKPITMNCTDGGGPFACTLPKAIKLDNSLGTKNARYWLSFVVNLAFSNGGGYWGWVQNRKTHNDAGQWENPGNGYGTGCTSWNDTSTCIPGANDDFAFDLKGSER